MGRPAGEGAELRADRRALVLAVSLALSVLAIGAAVQTEFVLGASGSSGEMAFVARPAANFTAIAVMAVMIAALGVHRVRSRRAVLARLAVASLVAASVRVGALVTLGVHDVGAVDALATELVGGVVCAAVAGLVGAAFTESRRRLRDEVRSAAVSRMQIELALRALQHEEVRVRREVAEGLHGSLQQRLVLAVARLDRVLGHLADDTVTSADADALREIRTQLEEVREGDVREMSRMLYPDQLEVGMVPAVRSLLGRLPSSIATRLQVPDDVRALDDPAAPVLTRSERLLAVRVVEEAVTNALRHGGATSVQVTIGLDGHHLVVTVVDSGSGFVVPESPLPVGTRTSGTARLAERLELVGGGFEVASQPGRGTRVAAWFPVGGLVGT